MPTIAEEDLVLYRYQELDPARAAEVRAALDADPALAARYRALERTLAAVDLMPSPAPAPDLGERVWARVEARLDEPRAVPLAFGRGPWLAFAAAAGLAALVVVSSGVRPTAPEAAAPVADAVAFTPQARERVLLTRVAHHLDGSQRLLASVSNTEPTRADLAEARAWAERALSANRIYRTAAAGAGETRMVALLDAMEPLLIEIANAPETLTAGELAFLQQRIEDADLLFRMRSAQKRIETRANQPSTKTVQPTTRSDI
jgi:hypothetical protein